VVAFGTSTQSHQPDGCLYYSRHFRVVFFGSPGFWDYNHAFSAGWGTFVGEIISRKTINCTLSGQHLRLLSI
jgi:hypothetical protein